MPGDPEVRNNAPEEPFKSHPADQVDRLDRISRLALMRGYITFVEIQKALAEQDENIKRGQPPEVVSQILIRKKWLRSKDLLAISLSPQAEERFIGRYRLLYPIARGSYGVVYRAHDPKLDREIAIKAFENITSKRQFQRLELEAQLGAGLDHPNIVKIHDSGRAKLEKRSVHFIAMEYIEGDTFERFEDGHDPVRALDIFMSVIKAMKYVHEQGVVHRDLKPANILLDLENRPLVTDFGLARHENTARVTQTGALIGTAHYMAPEQVLAERDQVGPPTDIWALGVILYECQTGHKPFEGKNLPEVFLAIRNANPPPPRQLRPEMSEELESICLKTLQRETSNRYPHAQALLEDLVRLHEGTPVHAHTTSEQKRLSFLKDRKYQLVISCLLILVFGIFWLSQRPTRSSTQNDSGPTQVLTPLLAETESCLQAILSLRKVGNTQAMAQRAQASETVCREFIHAHPQLAEPHYQLGRIYRALMRNPEALAEQQRALSIEPKHPNALYERILLATDLILRRISELEKGEWALEESLARLVEEEQSDQQPNLSLKALSLKAIALRDRSASNWIDQVRSDLKSLLQHPETTPPLPAGPYRAIRGLHAWFNNDPSRARDLLAQAHQMSPDLSEIYRILATIELYEGHFEQSIDWWSRGLSRDAGYSPYLTGRGWTYFRWARSLAQKGKSPEPLIRKALSDMTQMIKISPGLVDVLWSRATTNLWFANFRVEQQRDPTPYYEAAQEDYEQALRKRPTNAQLMAFLGQVRGWWGAYHVSQDIDPSALWESARENFNRAIALHPENGFIYMLRGSFSLEKAWQESRRGHDPSPLLKKSLEDFNQSIELQPESISGWRLRGTLLQFWAGWKAGNNQDPAELFRRAAQDMQQALKRSPKLRTTRYSLAGTHSLWMQSEAKNGRDPTPHYKIARDLFLDILTDYPDHTLTKIRLGALVASRAFDLQNRKPFSPSEVRKLFDEALEHLTQSCRLQANRSTPWSARAVAHYRYALFLFSLRQNGFSLLNKALHDANRAVHLSPIPQHRLERATIIHSIAQFRLKLSSRTYSSVTQGIQDLDIILRSYPHSKQARHLRAQLHTLRARSLGLEKKDPNPSLQAALADFNTLRQQSPQNLNLTGEIAEIHRLIGHLREIEGKDPTPHFREAIGELKQLIVQQPKNAPAWRSWAGCCLLLAQYYARTQNPNARSTVEYALEGYRRAVELRPSLKAQISKEQKRAIQLQKNLEVKPR